jgi:transcriptional regulator with XRE-family HTH domain
MSEKTNIILKNKSDQVLLKLLSSYIRYNRLDQNKTQNQLALEAGINRSTLIEFEKGKRSNLITFIQLLRALDLLHVLNIFRVEQQISPLLLAEMDMAKRKRASKTKAPAKKNKSTW